jgi:hypothetical protein
MQSPNESKNIKPVPSPEDMAWAKEKMKDVLFGCVLNVKLYQTGYCPKLLHEMNAEEFKAYTMLIDGLHLKKSGT